MFRMFLDLRLMVFIKVTIDGSFLLLLIHGVTTTIQYPTRLSKIVELFLSTVEFLVEMRIVATIG